jgi:hypothetical protein
MNNRSIKGYCPRCGEKGWFCYRGQMCADCILETLDDPEEELFTLRAVIKKTELDCRKEGKHGY